MNLFCDFVKANEDLDAVEFVYTRKTEIKKQIKSIFKFENTMQLLERYGGDEELHIP